MKSARELVDRLRAYQPPNTDLGQHFLIDDEMLDRMISIAEVCENDHILEIGPGPGTLTQRLLATGARVTAIEIDDAPVLHLDEAFREHSAPTLMAMESSNCSASIRRGMVRA